MQRSEFNVENSASVLNAKIYTGFGLLATVAVLRFVALGLYPLYDPSESRYAEMGRKMLETGNWVTPMIDYSVPFWGKPPLTIWLTALSMGVGGINEFSARLPSFLLGLVICWLTFYLANFERGADKAHNAVIILASSVLFFVMSGTVAMDQCMTFGTTLALASFWLALHSEKQFWGYVFFIGLSIGLLAKGPIAVVLCGITIGLWTAISREWSNVWRQIPWINGTVLMLIISVPWFLTAEQRTPGFLDYFIIGEHWHRFTQSGWKGDLYGVGRAHPRGMIWVYWLAATFPWSLLFLKTLFVSYSNNEPKNLISRGDGWRLYCLLWMVAPLAFFTFSANIIWTYVLPGLPGFALLLSEWLSNIRYKTIMALCVPFAFMGLVAAYHFPEAEFYKSQKKLVDNYLQKALPDERLVYLDERPDSAQFYTHGKALKLTSSPALQIDTDRHDFYAIKKESLDNLSETIKARLNLVHSHGHFQLFQAADTNEK